MNPEEQENDTLSERVAKVLGWQTLQLGWIRSAKLACPPVNLGDFQCLPAYASDYSLLPEMLAWLRELGCCVTIEDAGDGAWRAFDYIFGPKGYGDTIPAAVARLIIAVAEDGKSKESSCNPLKTW